MSKLISEEEFVTESLAAGFLAAWTFWRDLSTARPPSEISPAAREYARATLSVIGRLAHARIRIIGRKLSPQETAAYKDLDIVR